MDEAATKEEMRPVKSALVRSLSTPPDSRRCFLTGRPSRCVQKTLKTGTDNLEREAKVSMLKECLSVVGARIEVVVAAKRAAGQDEAK